MTGRHRSDFATLAALVAARDFRSEDLSRTDRRRLRNMIAATRSDTQVMATQDDMQESLARLERAAGL